MELVTRWVAEEGSEAEEGSPGRLTVLAVLLASLGLTALPPAVGLLILFGLIR